MSIQFSSCCEDLETLKKEAPLVYTVYAFTGGCSFVCTFGLFLIYSCKKTLRTHPNGILIHVDAFPLCHFFNLLYKWPEILEEYDIY